MWISEVFGSIQGEGLFAGTPSAFIRTCGCNLRCWFCDTPETSWRPRGTHREWESLVEEVEGLDIHEHGMYGYPEAALGASASPGGPVTAPTGEVAGATASESV